MDTQQVAHEIIKRGGKVESAYGDEIVVSSGKVNHAMHFLLGFPTLGLWWILVWLPVCLVGGSKRRVIHASSGDTRLPNELPKPALTLTLALCGFIVLMAAHVPFITTALIILSVAFISRWIANSQGKS